MNRQEFPVSMNSAAEQSLPTVKATREEFATHSGSDMSEQESIIASLRALESGDDRALNHFWNEYFSKVVAHAKQRLGTTPRREFDEEDVAISVFNSLNRAALAGRLENINSRDEVWRLLAAVTARKAIDRIRERNAQKRGGGQLRGESVFFSPNETDRSPGIDGFENSEMKPRNAG